MGLVKDSVDLFCWLSNYGFRHDNSCVAGNCSGYERTYYHSGNERLWVTVSFSKRQVYMYNEWECGGLLWQRNLYIPEEICSTDEERFINWLDNELDIN